MGSSLYVTPREGKLIRLLVEIQRQIVRGHHGLGHQRYEKKFFEDGGVVGWGGLPKAEGGVG